MEIFILPPKKNVHIYVFSTVADIYNIENITPPFHNFTIGILL